MSLSMNWKVCCDKTFNDNDTCARVYMTEKSVLGLHLASLLFHKFAYLSTCIYFLSSTLTSNVYAYIHSQNFNVYHI
jgi:hypothetical protein